MSDNAYARAERWATGIIFFCFGIVAGVVLWSAVS
jgi:hypothetical protein